MMQLPKLLYSPAATAECTSPIDFSRWPIRDINSRVIFEDPKLCSQFLRDNTDISLFKNVQPEDIEDVTKKYQAFLGISFESDSVKKIRTHNDDNPELYIISLIEHKSQVDYNVSMQLLHYMSCIWKEYAKEKDQETPCISKTKSFRYPPILPIVYYEGTNNWTADLNLKDRIFQHNIFEKYIPDFSYHVVRIHDYSNDFLLSRENEMSLLMLINKVQTPDDLARFLQMPSSQIYPIIEQTPPHILEIIASTLWSLCMKMNVPQEEASKYVQKIKERKMGYLFENMEKMDIQAERRKTQEAREQLEREQKKLLILQEKIQQASQQLASSQEQLASSQEQLISSREQLTSSQELLTASAVSKIKSIIQICQDFHATEEYTISRLTADCSLSLEDALEAIQKYRK